MGQALMPSSEQEECEHSSPPEHEGEAAIHSRVKEKLDIWDRNGKLTGGHDGLILPQNATTDHEGGIYGDYGGKDGGLGDASEHLY